MLAGDFGIGFQSVFTDLPLILLLVTAGLLAFHLGGNGSWRVLAAAIVGMLLGVLAAHLELYMPYGHWVVLGALALIGLAVAIKLEAPVWPSLVAMALPSVYVGRAVLGLGQFGVLTWLGYGAGFLVVMAATLGLANLIDGTGAGRVVRVAAAGVSVACVLILAGVIG